MASCTAMLNGRAPQRAGNAFNEPLDSPWVERMAEAVAESLPEIVLEPISDYLVLPQL